MDAHTLDFCLVVVRNSATALGLGIPHLAESSMSQTQIVRTAWKNRLNLKESKLDLPVFLVVIKLFVGCET